MTNQELQACIIFQDANYIVANKPPGVSAQDDHVDNDSLHRLLEKFVNKSLFVVHRLDRPTSGVILFAKRKSVAAKLNRFLKERSDRFSKTYLAAVKNPPSPNKGKLEHLIYQDKKQRKAFITEATEMGKPAILNYEVISQTDHYHLLKIKTETGRFHQIRAQLSAIGSPIKGDVKYGARRKNKDRSIHLHAFRLDLSLWESDQQMSFYAKVPEDPVWNAFKQQEVLLAENTYKEWKEEPM